MSRALGAPGTAADDERVELLRLRARAAEDASTIENLQDGMRSARTIGMAMGIIMAREKVTPEQAFAVLSRLSQQQNLKARHVAEQIVLTGDY